VCSSDLSKVEGETLDQMKERRYTDRITGDIDYPSRGNRGFGRWDANINKNLHIGNKNDNNTGDFGANSYDGEGTVIGATIAFAVEETGRLEISNNAGELVPSDSQIFTSKTGEREVDKKKRKTEAINIKKGYQSILLAYDNFNKDIVKGKDEESDVTLSLRKKAQVLYTWVTTWEGMNPPGFKLGTGSGKGGHRRMKKEILFQLQALLRSDDEGVLNNINPLIPIEFSMEIDGTGALFPGNSFHSSYLQKRYKEESIFQMVAVGHKVDPSGWTTTIKGQIRAASQREVESEVEPEEKPSSFIGKRRSEVRVDIKENNIEGTPNFLGGIDALDAAFYLAGGQSVLDKAAKRRAATTVSLLNEQLAAGNDAWTKNKGLVTQLQSTLSWLGIDMDKYGGIDGGFGTGTKKALALFSSKFGERVAGFKPGDLGTFQGVRTAKVTITRRNILSHIITEGVQGYGNRGG
jgi:peptidoglycan hydrolase-like protein with peptidoglycan-binding domain